MNHEKKWYVVYTRPRWEKKVASFLLAKGIEHYCPLNKVLRQWTDRKKLLLEPLFKGYLFVKLEEAVKWDIKNVDGIINFVYWLGKPAHVKETEIVTIRKFLQEFSSVEVTERDMHVNARVVVKQGVLMNYQGIIIEIKGSRATVNIDSMGLELSALFDRKNLEQV